MENIKIPQDPIFIVGCPRSGTTLLQALLAAQESIYSFPETHFFCIISNSIKTDKLGFIESSCLHKVFEKIQEKMELKFTTDVADKIAHMAEEKRLTSKALFELLVYQYIHKELKDHRSNRLRWLEKTPTHVYCLEQIYELYPEAQFINIIRNPICVIHSRRKKLIYDRHLSVEFLANKWIKAVVSVEEFGNKHPGKIYSLKYEELVEKPEKELSALCNFLNIDLNIDRMKMYKEVSDRIIHPWETWKNDVKFKDIYLTNGSYKKELPLIDILKIQNITHEYMVKYGYRTSRRILQIILNTWWGLYTKCTIF